MAWSKRVLFPSSVIVLTSALSFCLSTAVKIKCSNVDALFYAKPGSHCTSYYKCTQRGHAEVQECTPGSMFDFYAQKCTRTSGTCYEPICTGRINGVYQDTTHECRRSFACQSGKLFGVDNCPPHHLYDGLQCVDQDLVMCDLPHTTAIGYPFVGDQRCLGRVDGSYSIDDCSGHITCKNENVMDVQLCSPNQRFAEEIQQCVPVDRLSSCSNHDESTEEVCKRRRDGSHFDPFSDDCKSFISCKDGEMMGKGKCSSEAVFNGELCVPTSVYHCPRADWNQNKDVCSDQENGLFINPKEGCASFVRCMFGRTVEVHFCPSGKYFNPEEGSCLFDKFADRRMCTDPIISKDCENRAEGLYQGIECTTYFYCANGLKTEYRCPENLIFNGSNCVPRHLYDCPLGDNICLAKPDGYYPDHQNGCRSYYYCSSGHKITYLCENGHIFDGKSCIRHGHSPGHLCHFDTICVGKSDGYHADVKTKCRSYVFCKNGEKITNFTCRGNNIFNGEKCVNPFKFTCGGQLHNCMPKKCLKYCDSDGFFPDLDSGCRNYSFCIAGKRTSLSCPTGQVFNGEICVSEDKYICPIYCDDTLSYDCSQVLYKI